MGGQVYTIRERKAIVDYIKEREAYGEIKGRKMWTEFENSGRTTRTWQSLKETFLKRILPDIHNPYYKLSQEEISSFRVGYSMIKNNSKCKLQIQTITNNKLINKQKENDKVDKNITSRASLNSSVETIVLEQEVPCYATADEIKKDLLSTDESEFENIPKSTPKPQGSSRDRVAYTQTLSPIVNQILKDFDSDVDDNDSETTEKRSNSSSKKTKTNEVVNKITPNRKCLSLKKTTIEEDDIIEISSKETVSDKNEPDNGKRVTRNSKLSLQSIERKSPQIENLEKSKNGKQTVTGNSQNPTPDSELPNNQEALQNGQPPKSQSKKRQHTGSLESENVIEKKKTRSTKSAEPSDKIGDKKKNIETTKLTKKKTRTISTDSSDTIIRTKEIQQEKKNYKKLNTPKINSSAESVTTEEPKEARNQNNNSSKESIKVINSKNDNNDKMEHIEAKIITIEGNTSNSSDEIFSNPHYQSVSLFSKQIIIRNDNNENKKAPVVMLPSNSENDTSHSTSNAEEYQPKSKAKNPRAASCDSLSKIFGYSNANRHNNSRRRKDSFKSSTSNSIKRVEISSSSSWSSASDSDFVSPPQTNKRRRNIQYRKPKSGRIVPLESDGTLLLTIGNKAYPIIRDDQMMTNYVNYKSGGRENTAQYWKRKYVDAKKRNAELAQLLKDNEESKSKRKRLTEKADEEQNQIIDITNENQDPEVIEPSTSKSKEITKEEPKKDETGLKFTFVKDNQVATFEGPWQVIGPIVEGLIGVFKDTTKEVMPAEMKTPQNEKIVEIPKITLTQPTPKKSASTSKGGRNVNKIEEEIFKEIEEIDKSMSQNNIKESNKDDQTKVTTRKRVKSKVANDAEIIVNEKKLQLIMDNTIAPPRRTRSSIEKFKKSVTLDNTTRDMEAGTSPPVFEEDSDIRYKFPSPDISETNKITENRVNGNVNKRPTRNKRKNKRLMKSPSESNVNQHNHSSDSLESMQGYRDSDFSPVLTTRIRRLSLPSERNARLSQRLKRSFKQKTSHLSLSSNSSHENIGPVQSAQTTIDSKIYKSESYDILMQNARCLRINLNKIDENLISTSENDQQILNLSPASQNVDELLEEECIDASESKTEAHSSNISLPASPEISIVESITIPKELLENIAYDCPSDELMPVDSINENQYPTLDEMLLCKYDDKMSIDSVVNTTRRQLRTPELSDIEPITVKSNSNSETLNEKLTNLILDSAKKIAREKEAKKAKLIKAKKRCSTPHKRISKLGIDVIDERMEYCIKRNGRNSCPPCFNEISTINNTEEEAKQLPKKKKEIIKVKILRPKAKRRASVPKSVENENNDSESGIFLHGFNETVDLIHNHSETCLHTNECLNESVVVVEDEPCMISLDSSLKPAECSVGVCKHETNVNGVDLDCLICDAQDGAAIFIGSSPQPLYSPKIPCSPTSLLTEDLSDELSPKKEPSNWFLLSEDENTLTTNNIEQTNKQQCEYMKKLFPVVVTVPDLSTITELGETNAMNEDSNQITKTSH